MNKSKKVLLYAFIASVTLTIPWFLFMNHYLNSSFTKVEAKVVSYAYNYGGDNVPVLEYKTADGNTYQDEGSFGYKDNNNLHFIPMPDVGSTVTAYYNNEHPDSITYLRDPFYIAMFFLPAAVFLFVLMAFLFITFILSRFAGGDSSTIFIRK